jgi:threonine aldolase
MMAAAALAAMEITLLRIKSIHFLTYEISTKLEGLGYKLALPAQTNMIVLDLAAMGIPGSAFVEYCAKYGSLLFPVVELCSIIN